MAGLVTERIFKGNPLEVFQGLRRFDQYPKYLPMVSEITVDPPKVPESVALVTFKINLVKTFYYSINIFEAPPERLWWNLQDSNLMKKSNGSWLLVNHGNHETKATYSLDIAFKGLIPQMMIDKVTQSSLEPMMDGFQRLVFDTIESSKLIGK